MEIIPNIHLISGPIVNCYLIVEPEGLTLIDTGIASYEKKIIGTITALGRSIHDLKHILLTHSDADHVGSLAALKAASRAKVYSSAIEAKAIEAGFPSREPRFNAIGKFLSRRMLGLFKFEPCKVDQILTPGMDLPVLDRLWVVPSAGHTPGHLSFYSAAVKILFAGDSVRSSRDELICSSGPVTWDEGEALASMRLQAAMRPRIVCVGHGKVVKNAVGKFPQ
jgi:glyoxylase-like metal-dependent hydrolase (beta-lactamase superfamily II)